MAVDTLFVADMDTLKSEVRLSAVRDGTDAEQIFERAVVAARAKIYARLGADVTNAWVAIAYVENPTTQEQVYRAAANLLETELVLLDLIDSLPHVFLDDAGGAHQSWNEEGTLRGLDADEREALRASKQQRIDEIFEMLSGQVDLVGQRNVKAHVPEQTNPPKLGGSAFYCPDGYEFDGNFHNTGLNPQN